MPTNKGSFKIFRLAGIDVISIGLGFLLSGILANQASIPIMAGTLWKSLRYF